MSMRGSRVSQYLVPAALVTLMLSGVGLATAIATNAPSGPLRGYGGMMGGGMMGRNLAAQQCTPPAASGTVARFRAMDSGRMMGGVMMRLMPAGLAVHSGSVTIELDNVGTRPHELLVYRLAAGERAGNRSVLANDRVAEDASVGEVRPVCAQSESIDGIAAGNVARVTLDLAPGRYEVVCNLPGHYRAGMWATLVVR